MKKNTKNHLTRSEYELLSVMEKHDAILKTRMKEQLTHAYFNAMVEIEKRRLVVKVSSKIPRIDYFLYSMLHYVFYKLHKGDKTKAYEILNELKEKVISEVD